MGHSKRQPFPCIGVSVPWSITFVGFYHFRSAVGQSDSSFFLSFFLFVIVHDAFLLFPPDYKSALCGRRIRLPAWASFNVAENIFGSQDTEGVMFGNGHIQIKQPADIHMSASHLFWSWGGEEADST